MAACAFACAGAALKPLSDRVSRSLSSTFAPRPSSHVRQHYRRLRFPQHQRVTSNSSQPKPSDESSTSSLSPSEQGESNGADSDTKTSDEQPSNPSFRTLRVVLSAISITGAIESLYLTFNKIFSSPGAICATQGCLDVLDGPFSQFMGIPLSLIGAASYSFFAYLCVWPLTADEEDENDDAVYKKRDAATRPLMLALSTVQFVFTMYLVALLKFIIRSMCPFCLFSAGLSAAMFILTAFVGRAVPRWQPALSISAAGTTVAVFAAAASLLTGWPAHIAAQPRNGPQAPPEITTRSDADALRIARKLSKKNATMYGAYWCSHCYDQKQRFGTKAFGMLHYIECDRHGVNTQFQLCRDKRVPGYPTWEIDGELFPGEIDLPELERLVDEASKP